MPAVFGEVDYHMCFPWKLLAKLWTFIVVCGILGPRVHFWLVVAYTVYFLYKW